MLARRLTATMFAVMAALLLVTAPHTSMVMAGPIADQHVTRGFNCRKGGSIILRLSNMVYMPGQKHITGVAAVPTHGKFFGFSGKNFDIPIRDVEAAENYLKNESLFRRRDTTGGFKNRLVARKYTPVRFMYKAPIVYNASGDPIDFPVTPRPMDYFNFTVEVRQGNRDPERLPITIAIDVINARPRAIPATFSIVGGQPRWVQLPAHDVDQANVEPLQEITAAWISAPSDGSFACTLKASPNATTSFDFRATPTVNISATALAVYVVPPDGFPRGSKCVFNYTVADRGGLVSDTEPVTLTATEPGKPRAYAARTRLMKGASTVPIELIGSSPNVDGTGPLAFFITEMPKSGILYMVDNVDEEPKPSQIVTMPQGASSVMVYNGTARRIRLIYQLKQPFPNGATAPQLDHVTFYVKDWYQQSEPADSTISFSGNVGIPPRCNNTLINFAFQDRSTIVSVDYGYTGPKNQSVRLPRINRLQLLAEPAKAQQLGYLAEVIPFENGTAVHRISLGTYFSDEERRLLWIPDPNATAVSDDRSQVYKYKVVTPEGLSCTGLITVMVTPRVKDDGVKTWYERAATNSWTLFALRDLGANQTVKGNVKSVIFDTLPAAGTLYTVTDDVPVEDVNVIGGYGRSMVTFCNRFDCARYKKDVINVSTPVNAYADKSAGYARLLVLYRAPLQIPDPKGAHGKVTATFRLQGENDADTRTQQVLTIQIYKGKLPVIEFYYMPPDKTNFSTTDEVRVPLKFSDANHAVEVANFDERRRHFVVAPFKLFQLLSMDGDRPKLGDRLAPSLMYGQTKNWLLNNNSAVLVPTTRSRSKVFKFRVRIHELADASTLAGKAPEEYRVYVRQNNTVPTWDFTVTNPTVMTSVGTLERIPIGLKDNENDLLTFRLLTAPRYGTLMFEYISLGTSAYQTLRTGMTFRPKRGALFQQQALLRYQCEGVPDDVPYPVKDSFTLAADDGSGIYSVPLTFDITVKATADALAKRQHNNTRPPPQPSRASSPSWSS
jgi:hypothetical protein